MMPAEPLSQRRLKGLLLFFLTKKLSRRNPEELAQGEFEKYFLI